MRALLVRGMAAGVAAGVLAFVVAYLVGEPQLQRGIDFAEGADPEVVPAPVSRNVQATVGLLTGTVLVSVAMGGLFALVFAYAYGRVSSAGARATSAVLAALAFLAVSLVPFTKYPPNPPGIGGADRIEARSLLFIAMIAVTVIALIAASRIRRQCLKRLGPWNASIVAAAVFVVLVVIAQAILPSAEAAPATFPAEVLYDFRIASLAVGGTIWLAIGLGFGALADGVLRDR